MKEKLLFGHDVNMKIPEFVYDDINCRLPGTSWASDPRNAHFVDKFKDDYYFREVILRNEKARAALFDPSGTITPGTLRWLEDDKEFKIMTGVLFKLGCASSMRDTEQMTLVMRESVYNPRSFFFQEDELILATFYDKMSYARLDAEPLPHPVYDRLTILYMTYFLVIYPYEAVLRWRLAPDLGVWAETKDLYFADHNGAFAPTVVSDKIKDETLPRFGRELGSADCRHITHAMSIHTCKTGIITRGDTNYAVLNANHSERTGINIYGRPLTSFGSKHPEATVQHLRVSCLCLSDDVSYQQHI